VVSVDFFTLIIHFAVTAHSTAEWTAQQMPAMGECTQYLLRDRDTAHQPRVHRVLERAGCTDSMLTGSRPLGSDTGVARCSC
jgi:hypothetical protein